MLSLSAIAGIGAGTLALLSFFPYVRGILHGKTRPNRATWWIWTIVAGIIVASYVFSNEPTGYTIILPISYFLGQGLIAMLSLKYGVGGWAPFDRLCLLGAGLSLILWWLLSSPLAALLVNIAVDFFGALPTIRKSYLEPETENMAAWLLTVGGDTLNLFAIQAITIFVITYPVYLFATDGIILGLLLLPFVRKRFATNHG